MVNQPEHGTSNKRQLCYELEGTYFKLISMFFQYVWRQTEQIEKKKLVLYFLIEVAVILIKKKNILWRNIVF